MTYCNTFLRNILPQVLRFHTIVIDLQHHLLSMARLFYHQKRNQCYSVLTVSHYLANLSKIFNSYGINYESFIRKLFTVANYMKGGSIYNNVWFYSFDKLRNFTFVFDIKFLT